MAQCSTCAWLQCTLVRDLCAHFLPTLPPPCRSMSFNPCPASAPPSWYPGEGLLVTADNVEFSLSLGRFPPRQSKATCKAKGLLHLTNIRLLFIATKPTASPVPGGPEFASFDIPLRGIVDVKFNQPIFGANNLQGKVTPVSCLEASAPVEWKAAFIAGGTTVLIPTLLRLMDQLHREAQGQAIPAQQLRTPQQQPYHGQPPQPQHHAPQQQQPWYGGEGTLPVAQAVTPGVEGGGYMDPSDPSRVLVDAPVVREGGRKGWRKGGREG